MEGESHLPRKPQSLSLEIKVFSFSVSLLTFQKWKNRKTKKLIDYFISEPRVIDVSYSFLRSCLFRRIPYILEIDRVRLREEDPIEKK